MSTHVLTIRDPRRRTAVLAQHEVLDEADAMELVAVYAAFGYAPEQIELQSAEEHEVAA